MRTYQANRHAREQAELKRVAEMEQLLRDILDAHDQRPGELGGGRLTPKIATRVGDAVSKMRSVS